MKRKILFYLGAVPLLMTAACQQPPQESAEAPVPVALESADESAPPALESDVEIYSYGAGYQIGSQMVAGSHEMDAASVVAGMTDAFNERESRVDQERLRAVLQRLQQAMAAQREAEGQQAAQQADEFMAANGQKDGVISLDSGLQYRVIESGEGDKPVATDTVVVHYRGTLIDGTEFDSSYARSEPARFAISAVIDGWRQILPIMPVGSKWEVYIPPALAYGSGGQGPIPPHSPLIFELELLEIVPPA